MSVCVSICKLEEKKDVEGGARELIYQELSHLVYSRAIENSAAVIPREPLTDPRTWESGPQDSGTGTVGRGYKKR